MAQFCNSGLMILHLNKPISAISDSCNLEAVDLIFSGTQVNIGELFIGDKLEAFIEDESVLEFEIE
jgi:acylpyruvate hydrolase